MPLNKETKIKSSSPLVNVIERPEFELAYTIATDYHFSLSATEHLPGVNANV